MNGLSLLSSYSNTLQTLGFPGSSDGKESTCNTRDPGLIPGPIPRRREQQPTPVLFPGESHGQRCLGPDGQQSMGSQRVRHN